MSLNNKKKNLKKTKIESTISSLSSKKEDAFDDIEKKLYDTLNAVELKKSMDRWLKTTEGRQATILRDLGILKGINEEYLDSFLVLGYTMDGERVIMQSYKSPKEKDALMEFLKVVFLQNHHGGFDE
jgi:hypothetical protein